jgi:hypothetical protein
MTTDQEVLDYYNTSAVEPGCSGTLSLSADGGFEGSQAVRVDYSLNYQSSWARINTDKNNLTASGEGLSFWINVSQPMRIQATAWSSWVMYTHDLITLEAGDNFVQVPWGDFKGREEWPPYNDVELSPNEPTRNLRIGFMLFPVEDELTEGTAYIDEIGFINTAPTTTVTIEPEQDYEVFQNFEGMTSQADLEGFFPYFAHDEDSSMTMSLSEGLGYSGSKCARFDYTQIAYWVNIGDSNIETYRYHAKGDGFSFWIYTSRSIEVRLDVYDSWTEYETERMTIEPGQQFVQIPWTSVKRKNDPTISIVPNEPGNSLMRVRLSVFNDGTTGPGTFYLDDIGYYTASAPSPAEPVIELISDIGTVTPASENSIAAAQAAYDALSEDDKLLVTNADVLAAAVAKFDSFRPTFRGVSIRTSAPWGLRFGTDFSNNAADGTGYSIVKYGTVVLSQQKYVSGELKVGTANALNSEGDILSEADVSTFGVTIINIPSEHYDTKVMARTYIVYENDVTKEQVTVYNAEGAGDSGDSKAFVCSTQEVADYFNIELD